MNVNKNNPFEILLDKDIIAKRISELGAEISEDYKSMNPIVIGVLKGCFVFMADLIREINIPLEIEFVSASSYKDGEKQGKKIDFISAVPIPLKGRHIIIAEGVIDSGRTAETIVKELRKKEPATIQFVTLIDKPGSHQAELDIKYKGFTVGNEFIIGFGLDNTQKYRNLPFIGKLIDK